MGWTAYYPDGTRLSEDTDGRPVQDGQDGKLAIIIQEDYGHRVAVDLRAGAIIIDYDELDYQNGTFGFINPRTVLYVCDETNIVGELVDVRRLPGRATKEGNIKQRIILPEFRPIWFTRHTNESRTKVIGVQTTLTKTYGGKNVKKMVSLFEDGRIGID